MTNPRYVENMIATAIVDREKNHGERFKLVFYKSKIQCIRRSKTEPDSFFICNITGQQLREGFSVPEWRNIAARAVAIMKGLI